MSPIPGASSRVNNGQLRGEGKADERTGTALPRSGTVRTALTRLLLLKSTTTMGGKILLTEGGYVLISPAGGRRAARLTPSQRQRP